MKIDQYQKENVNRRRAICEMDNRIYGQNFKFNYFNCFQRFKGKIDIMCETGQREGLG